MANEKHIFIGIGGSGCQTVSQIKSKVYEKRFPEATASKTRLQAMNDSYRFLFIDTDQRDIDEANKRNRESFEHGKVPFISPQTDLINLGRANPAAIYYEATKNPNSLINKRILESCSKELAVKIPDQPLAFGAGAFRMKSRIAFAHSLADFQSKLQSAVSSLNDVKTVGGEDCIIYYWVVGSTLGGTGSGIFNDVLYHVNQIHHQVVGNGDPQLVLTMFMPKVYIDSNNTEEKYTLNAYGVFSELKAFKKMSYEDNQKTVMHRLSFQNDYSLIDNNKRYCPFYYLIPIDIQTDKGTSLGTTHTMYRNTAEMLYHLHNGKAGATFRSDIDNYMNDIMERDHEDFLVPMGYVSLQKPREQFDKYMRTRFRRDLLRNYLLNEEAAKVEKADEDSLYFAFVKELDPSIDNTIAHDILLNTQKLKNTIANADTEVEKLSDEFELDNLQTDFNNITNIFADESSEEKRRKYKKYITDCLWKKAEDLIRKHGLAYTSNALTKVREKMCEKYKEAEEGSASFGNRQKELEELKNELREKCEDAMRITTGEKLTHSNKKDIASYIECLNDYTGKFIKLAADRWAHDLLRDFCQDEKNDVMSVLRKHVNNMQDKVSEMNRAAVTSYKKLATTFGDTAMDVTTVYLPMLKTICDGNGWIQDNFFSKMYTKLVNAQGKEEIPDRKDLLDFIDHHIYLSPDENTMQAINKGEFKVAIKPLNLSGSNDEEALLPTEDNRFFANPDLAEKGVSMERVIEEFLTLATICFEKKLHEDGDIQEKWDNRKISEFFSDLTNEVKDEVRRSLNPALFFSYNSNRIEVTTREEHLVFVAGNEDLATEMLGFQKGNNKHRYEKSDDENTALVLKSKFGLSLDDYRIYNSIKTVYDNATFREKYHFHHDFAQFLDKITLDDLPYEELPQHHSFVKMLLLDAYRNELNPLFYRDEYDEESYTNTLYMTDENCDTYFKIAIPEALTQNTLPGKAPIIIRKENNGRSLFIEIEGADFTEQFGKYVDLYHNYRFGETTERLIQEVLRQKLTLNGQTLIGEDIFKRHYAKKRDELLKYLSQKKKDATQFTEQRIYNAFFTILRDKMDTVHKFIKSNHNS